MISEEYSLLMGMGMGGNRRMMKMGPDNGGGLGEKLTIAKFQINDDAATPGELPKLPGQNLSSLRPPEKSKPLSASA